MNSAARIANSAADFIFCNVPANEEMTRVDTTSRKTQSLARLIAEEAFSRPPPQPATNVPVVRIVGRKLILMAAAAPEPVPMQAQDASNEPAKKPRVFVIRPAGHVDAAPENETPIEVPHRIRRRANAPAPLQVIYRAPERPAPPPVVSLEGLAGSLAGIQPTLDIIRRAMAFDFSDPAMVAEWEQLSRAADELSELIAS